MQNYAVSFGFADLGKHVRTACWRRIEGRGYRNGQGDRSCRMSAHDAQSKADTEIGKPLKVKVMLTEGPRATVKAEELGASAITGRRYKSSKTGGGDSDTELETEKALKDVPFELISEIASAGAVAETSHVEGGSSAGRHVVGSIVWELGFRTG